MAKGGKSGSSADTVSRTESTTTTNIGDIGIQGDHLVQLVDIIETASLARSQAQPISAEARQPYTSFAPEATVVQPLTGGPSSGGWVLYAGLGLAALALVFAFRRR